MPNPYGRPSCAAESGLSSERSITQAHATEEWAGWVAADSASRTYLTGSRKTDRLKGLTLYNQSPHSGWLIARIEKIVQAYNKTWVSCKWTATADSIIEKLRQFYSQTTVTLTSR